MLKKINYILDKKLKIILFYFFIVTALISVLEILSIGLMIPLISSILDENFLSNNIQKFSFFSDYSNSQIIIALLALIVSIYFFKALSLLFFSWLQFSYVAKLEATLCKKLYTNYLSKSYKFFTNINSSELIRNITKEVHIFSNQIIFNGLNFFLEILIVIFISIFLFIFNPKITFFLLALCFCISFILIKLFKNKITQWSKERQHHEKMKIQHIQQGIGGIKEIKIFGNEKKFVEYYDKHNQRYAIIDKYFNVVSQSPKIILEFFAILFFCTVIIFSYLSGMNNSEILVMLAVFAAAAFRLLPSFNRLNLSYSNFRFGIPSIDILYDEKIHESFLPFDRLNENFQNSYKEIDKFDSNLLIKNLYFGYNEDYILEDINLNIKKNSITGIVGSSGSGKSTLVDLLIGLHKPLKGKILIDNTDITLFDQNWRNLIGYVPQNIYLLDDSLKKNIAFGLNDSQIDKNKVINSLKLAELYDFVKNNLKEGIYSNIGEGGIKLSGGQRQRIGIARALYKDPQIIFFDEFTSSLDLKTEDKILNTINAIKKNKTIIIISHRESSLKVCDNIYEINRKKIQKIK